MTLQLTSGYLRNQLRYNCTTLGGKDAFGFDRMDIGTKSIRPGGCYYGLVPGKSLNQEYMLIVHRLSQGFLVYSTRKACDRPQVIEWTNKMSRDMICHDSFTNASGLNMADPKIAQVPPRRFNGPDNLLIIPTFHLDH